MDKISFNQIDAYMKWCATDSANFCEDKVTDTRLERVVLMGEDDAALEVHIVKYITIDKQVELINTVAANLFANNEYNYHIASIILDTAYINYFTNIKTTGITPERLMFLIYNTDIITYISEFAAYQICDIQKALKCYCDNANTKIGLDYENKYDKLREQIRQEQDDLVAQVESLVSIFEKLGKDMENLDIGELAGNIRKITDISNEKLVNNVLKTRETDAKA